MIKYPFIPKETKFFAFFEQDGENLVKMAQELKDIFYIFQNVKERASIIADMEQAGDAITHDIMTLLYRTFVTPIDREDITALAHSIDVVADRIHEVADLTLLYDVKVPLEAAKELSSVVLQAVSEVKDGISEVNINIRKDELFQKCVTINQIENYGDSLYRTALAKLFTEAKEAASILKWREILQKLESAIDACEDVANVLEGIALKSA
jgi:predicted phosphate transport protein (TIGR00153 family)